MYDDDDIMYPVDEEAEAAQAAAKEAVEEQKEIDGANDVLYQTAYETLLNNGYTQDQAAYYYCHPQVVDHVRRQLDQEAYQEFLKEYPNVKPEEIPKKAWESFMKNGNLVKSFERNEPFLKAFMADMPKTKATPPKHQDPFQKGFDSID